MNAVQTLAPSSHRWLELARWVTLALIIFSIGTLVLGIALFPTYGANNLQNVSPNNNWTPEKIQVALEQLGWSPLALSWFYAVLSWLISLAYCAVGLIVFRRKSDDWFGLYVAVMFSVFGTSGGLATRVLYQVSPLLGAWQDLVGATAWQLLFILFYLFPDGHFVPRWTRWLLLPWIGLHVTSPVAPSLEPVIVPLIAVLVFSTMGSQIYRYFRHSDATQRQQTKWIVFMVGVFALIMTVAIFSFTNPAPFGQKAGANFVFASAVQVLADLWLLLFPITIGIAILKYRLWDIDIIIRRTLVYVPLTAIIAGIFAASIVLSQRFFLALTGASSDFATGFATLITVAAFEPIKSRIQAFVDKRFKEAPDPAKRLSLYDEQLESVLQIFDPQQTAKKFLDEAVAAFDAEGGTVYLHQNGHTDLLYKSDNWNERAQVSVPLRRDGKTLGAIELGKRRNGMDYTTQDRATLEKSADLIARALTIAHIVQHVRD